MNIRWNSGLLIPGYNKGEVEKFTQNFKNRGKVMKSKRAHSADVYTSSRPRTLKREL